MTRKVNKNFPFPFNFNEYYVCCNLFKDNLHNRILQAISLPKFIKKKYDIIKKNIWLY